jgi:serine O-acetyltransferase
MPPQISEIRQANIEAYDPIWERIRSEAEEIARREPALGGFIFANVLNHPRLDDAICHRIAHRLGGDDVSADLIRQSFDRILGEDGELPGIFRADLAAVADRDAACTRIIEPLLYFKGFHALETQRFSHRMWKAGDRDFALYLQSQASRVFAVDIHPAARIGRGIMLDHATGIVIGETAEVGDMSSLLHGVTLGGSGKEGGDRHPKVGRHVMIGAGAKILGNIKIGHCARIAAGSVVLKEVPPNTTVAGVPAKVVGKAGCPDPARSMNQMLGLDDAGPVGETDR